MTKKTNKVQGNTYEDSMKGIIEDLDCSFIECEALVDEYENMLLRSIESFRTKLGNASLDISALKNLENMSEPTKQLLGDKFVEMHLSTANLTLKDIREQLINILQKNLAAIK